MRSFSHRPPRASLDSRGGCGRRIEHGLAAGGVVRLGYGERELKRSSTDPQLHEIGFRNRDNGTVNDGLERMRPIGSGQRSMDAGCLRRRTFGCPEVATSRRRATCSTALTCGHPVDYAHGMCRRAVKVAILGINYAPEPTGIAPYTTRLATGLAERGHDVRVLTGFPHYPQWRRDEASSRFRSEEEMHGVLVRRLNHSVPRQLSWIGRAAMEVTFVGVIALDRLRPSDVEALVLVLRARRADRAQSRRVGDPTRRATA